MSSDAGHSRIRLLVLTDRYPPRSAGGYETACYAVTERLRAWGVPCLVLSTTSRAASAMPEESGRVVRALHQRKDSPSLVELARWERRDHHTLTRIVGDWRPTVIYMWSLLQWFPSMLRLVAEQPVPAVFNIQDLWLPSFLADGRNLKGAWAARGPGLVKGLIKAARFQAMGPFVPAVTRPSEDRHADLRGAVFCSAFRQAQHQAEGFDISGSRVIYNGIDTALFSPAAVPLPARPMRMLAVGRLVSEKGFDTAIAAMRALRDAGRTGVTLTIAGYDSYPYDYGQALRASVAGQGLGDYVSFVEPVPYDRMADLLRQHHVLIFPSTGPEGLPMSVLEAMSCGLCVVGTQTGGTGEALTDETGLVFRAGDATALASHINRLLDDAELATVVGKRARQMVLDRFAIDTIAAATMEHLELVARRL